MVTRTPRLALLSGNGPATNGVAARTASAYSLIPQAGRNIGGVDADRKAIDTMLRGGQSADPELGWYYWARIPELRYITRYIANSVSMARLFVGKVTDDPTNPTPVGPRHPANDLLASFAGGVMGQAEVLDRLALHLTVPGDSILAGPDEGAKEAPRYPFDRWRVFSTTEITSRNGALYYKGPTGRDAPLPAGVRPIRVWRPHPRLLYEADSPTRSSYSVLREIDLLDQHVHATAVSRLAGAGLLAIPDELTIPGDEVETEGVDVDPFVKMLTEIMSLAIKDRESAAAIVPIVLRGPGEYIAQIKHFDFATKFDEAVTDHRNVALRRLALGMDVPPEIMMGTGETSHWNSWMIDESSLRVHIIPLLQLIVGALTEGWFRPALEQVPLSEAARAEADNLVIWFDYSNLVIHPNVSEDAEALYDRFELSGDSLRLRAGAGDGEAPTKAEKVVQACFKLVRDNDQMAPYAVAALRELGYPFPEVNVPAAERPVGRPTEPGPADGQSPPSKPLPGKRSQDKPLSPPPAPPPSGDGSRNG